MNRRYYSLITVTMITLLIIGLTPSTTLAEEERELEIGVYDDYVEILSYFENDTFATEFEIRSDTQGGEGHLAIEMEFRLEIDNGTYYKEFAFEMEVVYLDLIEFVDENEDGKYDVDDTIVKTVPLGDQGVVYYDAPTSNPTSIGGVPGHRIVLTGNVDGIGLNITSEIYTTDVVVDGLDLDPTQVKITIGISDFVFDQTDTLLALKNKVTTETELEIESEGDDTVEISSEFGTGSYSISDVASVDGVDANVGVSTIDDGEIFMYSAYPQGDIVHDPLFGFDQSATSSDSSSSNGDEEQSEGGFLPYQFLIPLAILPILSLTKRSQNRR